MARWIPGHHAEQERKRAPALAQNSGVTAPTLAPRAPFRRSRAPSPYLSIVQASAALYMECRTQLCIDSQGC